MDVLLTVIHILVALALILIVLLQSGKGSDIAGAFGGMGSQAAFGPRGTATFLSKATVALAAVFMVTSVTLSIRASRGSIGGDSLLSDDEAPTAPASPTVPAPAAPATPGSSIPSGIQVRGLEGVGVNVTVENPEQAPTPAGQEEAAPAPAQQTPPANQPASPPSGQ
jgi:preprotein translocase subunit SecG